MKFELFFGKKPSSERIPIPMPAEEKKVPTQAEMIARLKEVGLEIVHSSYEKKILDLDFSGFETSNPAQQEDVQTGLRRLSSAVQDYLSGVMLADTFGADHRSRRSWRDRMTEEYGSLFTSIDDTNKLRLNNIHAVQMYFRLTEKLLDGLQISSSQANAVKELNRSFPEIANYNKLSQQERLALVSKVEEICTSFLEIIRKKEEMPLPQASGF